MIDVIINININLRLKQVKAVDYCVLYTVNTDDTVILGDGCLEMFGENHQ